MTTEPDTTDSWVAYSDHFEGTEACARCNKPTTSHALLVTSDFGPATKSDYDIVLPICHTCKSSYSFETLIENCTEVTRRLEKTIGTDVASILQAAVTGDYERTERIKLLGQESVQDALTNLKPGDVFYLNEDTSGKWVALPQDSDQGNIPDGVKHSLIKTGGDTTGGGLVETQHPFRDELKLAYEANQEVEIQNIESIEFVGHIPID